MNWEDLKKEIDERWEKRWASVFSALNTQSLSFYELCLATQLEPSVVHRILQQMIAQGAVRPDGQGKFELTGRSASYAVI